MLPINSFANDTVDCHSANSDVGDSAYWAEKSIDLFAKNKFEQAVKTVDACFGLFSYAAVVMQKDFNAKNSKAPPSGKVNRKEKKKIYPKDYKYAKFEIMSNLTEENTNYIYGVVRLIRLAETKLHYGIPT